MRSLGILIKPCALASVMSALLAASTIFAASGDTVADRVFGQANFTSNAANRGLINASASSLNQPVVATMDSSGRLWVADETNHRVLEFDAPLTSPVANRVFGQPNFTSHVANNGGLGSSSLSGPVGVALDSSGRLWVADNANNRVLEYDSPLVSAVASRVFGQPNFTSNAANNGGINAGSLSSPFGVAVDSSGRLWVADLSNNRVLEYDSPLASAVASRVFGQPNFTSNAGNNGGVSESSMSSPYGVSVDGSGRLWVADFPNHRVLEYDAPLVSAVATRVFGQPNFTSNAFNNGGLSASSLGFPAGAVLDSSSRLWVADTLNNRVLEYDSPLVSAVATRVFGQPNFTSNAVNSGGLGASSLSAPSGIAVSSGGDLWVADFGNNRVLEYDVPVPPPSVGGIAEQPDLRALPAPDASSGRGYSVHIVVGALAGIAALVAMGGWWARRRSRA